LEEDRFRVSDKEVREERLEPGCVIIFVAVNDLLDRPAEFDCGARPPEVELLVLAIGAFERDRDLSFEGKPAAVAERRFDVADAVTMPNLLQLPTGELQKRVIPFLKLVTG